MSDNNATVTAIIDGGEPNIVTVTATVTPGLPYFSIIGLTHDPERLSRARARIRETIERRGIAWPGQRVTIVLTPSEPSKDPVIEIAMTTALIQALGHAPQHPTTLVLPATIPLPIDEPAPTFTTEIVHDILDLYEQGLHNLTRTRFIPNEPIRYLGNSTQDGVVSDHQAHEYDNAWAEWVTLLAWLTANDDDDTLIATTTRQLNELGVGTTTQILRNRADKTEPDNRFYSHAAEDGTI